MAILTQVTQLVDGVDTVTAKDIMDTQETAINANNNATTAVSTANSANTKSDGAVSTANSANTTANTANTTANEAKTNANTALTQIATEVTNRTNADNALQSQITTNTNNISTNTTNISKKLEKSNIKAGSNVTISVSGNDVTISSTGGAGGDYVDLTSNQNITGIKSFVNGFNFKGYDASQLFKYNVPLGTAVPSSANLNTVTYLKVGSYYCPADATVQTLSNCPTDRAFMMEVTSPLSQTINNESSSAWVYRLRILTTYTGLVYYQLVNSSATAGSFTYGAWTKVAMLSNSAKADYGDKQGCIDLPNGTRIIYGYIGSVTQDGSTNVTFYGSNTFASNPTVMLASYSGTRKTWYYMNCVSIASTSTTGFQLYSRDYTFGRYYLAIGKSPL